MPLADQVTVLTGASSGIGRCIALALAEKHARLCLVGRREAQLHVVANEVREAGGQAQVYLADLASEEELSRASEAIVRDFGKVDVLVHCAGMISMGPIATTPVEDLDRLYRVNLRAPYLLTQRLLPFMPAGEGQIVFVNSSAGFTAKTGVSQYASTKHGLKALADSLRDELSDSGIRVFSIYPARTATPMQEEIFRHENRIYQPELLLQPESVARSIMHVLTMPRDAEITDLAIRGVANMSVS